MASRLDRPIFIIAAPRSGSTLLYETLIRHSDLVSMQNESHAVIEHIPALSTVSRGFVSNALSHQDATAAVKETLTAQFLAHAVTNDGAPLSPETSTVRFLEKTPKNALRVDFLHALYPDAKFVYLVREPVENTASIMEAWLSEKFVTYPHLPGWDGHWSLLLPPQWQSVRNKPLAHIAAFQWAQANRHACASLTKVDKQQVLPVSYQMLVSQPQQVIDKISEFADLPTQPDIIGERGLPLSRYTLSNPAPDKWRHHAREIAGAGDVLAQALAAVNELFRLHGIPELSMNPELRVAAQTTPQSTSERPAWVPPTNRNATCPCGSGRRYKQCHGRLL